MPLLFLGNEIDLTYSALKVQQNTGRGEVKRNPCLEITNRQVPKVRQNLCHPHWGFYILLPDLQGFRCAPPPACNLTPRRGLCGTECRTFHINCYIMANF